MADDYKKQVQKTLTTTTRIVLSEDTVAEMIRKALDVPEKADVKFDCDWMREIVVSWTETKSEEE